MHQGLFSPVTVVMLGENATAWCSFVLAFGDQGRALKMKEFEVTGAGLHTQGVSECGPCVSSTGAVLIYMRCELDTWF